MNHQYDNGNDPPGSKDGKDEDDDLDDTDDNFPRTKKSKNDPNNSKQSQNFRSYFSGSSRSAADMNTTMQDNMSIDNRNFLVTTAQSGLRKTYKEVLNSAQTNKVMKPQLQLTRVDQQRNAKTNHPNHKKSSIINKTLLIPSIKLIPEQIPRWLKFTDHPYFDMNFVIPITRSPIPSEWGNILDTKCQKHTRLYFKNAHGLHVGNSDMK